MTFERLRRLLPAALLCTAACSGSGDLPEPQYWPGDDLRPELSPSFFEEHPQLRELSLYANRVEGPVVRRPDHQHRGAFGLGNGRIFALMGLSNPLNTMHSMVGPVYEKGPRFFGDTNVLLFEGDNEATFVREWISRVRGTAVIVTRADSETHSLYTVDFAPRPAGADGLDVPPIMVRIVLVTGRDGATDTPVNVRIGRFQSTRDVDGFEAEVIADPPRYAAMVPWEGEDADGPGLRVDLGPVPSGETKRAVFAMLTATSTQGLHSAERGLQSTSADEWLEETLDWWNRFSARGLRLELDDPRIVDIYDGMRVGVKVQQSVFGAICPMSQYTLVWLRDTSGTVRFLSRAGLHEDAIAGLDYLYGCHKTRGDISNACESGYSPDQFGEEPDWASMPSFDGKQRAEGPTYVVLGHRAYVEASGDWTPVEARWDYLRRAMVAQIMDAEGRQTFSDDETFRAAMASAMGVDIGMSWADVTWSANSSFLMVSAAGWMARAAEKLEKTADAEMFREFESRARSALQDQFLLEGGYYAPYIWTESGEAESRPYEDVSLKPVWVDAIDVEDPIALSNLRMLEEKAGRGPGVIQSHISDRYSSFLGLPIEEGMHTGMVPGFYLFNLTAIGDPNAAAAFDQIHEYADQAGQFNEYGVFDDHSALSPAYDQFGVLGDYTARHRPWEGGINVSAALFYLLGARSDAFEGTVSIRPHLPNGLPKLVANGFTMGKAAANISLARTEDGLSLSVDSTAASSFSLQVDLPIPSDVDAPGQSTIDDTQSGQLVTLPGAERVIRFESLEVAPGSAHVFFVSLD